MDKINLDTLIGSKSEERHINYGWRESALYALSVGAKASDLQYIYELKGDMKAVPTFGAIPYWAAVGVEPHMDLPDSATLRVREAVMPGEAYLHMGHELVIHKPINAYGKQLNYHDEIEDIYDRGEGKGVVARGKLDVYDENGELLCTNYANVFFAKGGGYGGKPMPKSSVVIPEREPDFVLEDYISPVQNLYYRLTGDTNLIHVDPEYAKGGGLPGPILQGLCSMGFACRMAIDALIPGEPERVTRIAVQMTSPVLPDTPVELQIWKMEEGKAYFRFINKTTGKKILDRGEFEWK